MARGLRRAGELLAATICASLRAAQARAFAARAARGLGEGSRTIVRAWTQGTGAKVVNRVEVCSNCVHSFAHLSLRVQTCQTKLSHFDGCPLQRSPGNVPTGFMPAAGRPYCILCASDLRMLKIVGSN